MNISFMRMNTRPTPPLLDFAVFVAVAETEGFTAAALRLGVSKAMVSTAVTRLEARLGVRLFQRTTRQLSLTEAGAATLPHAQRCVLAGRDAEEAATHLLAAPRGVLRLNAPMSFGLLHVVPALGEFAKAFPEVSIDLVLDDRVLDLTEGAFDLALRIGTAPDSLLVARPLARSRNVIVAHPKYLAKAGVPKTPAALADHAALTYSLSASGSKWVLTRGSKTETVKVKGPLQANNSLALHRALHQHLGLARIPLFIVGEDLAKGRLVQVLPDWHFPEQTVHALTTSRDALPRKTQVFIEFFRKWVGAPPYWESGRAPNVRPSSPSP